MDKNNDNGALQAEADNAVINAIRRENARAERLRATTDRIHRSSHGSPLDRLNGCCDGKSGDESLLYNSIEEVNAYILMGMYLYKHCDTVNHLVDSVVQYAIGGREIKYTVSERESPLSSGGVPKSVGELQNAIDIAITSVDFVELNHNEAIRREHITGDVLRQANEEDGYLRASYIEPYQLTDQIGDFNPGATEEFSGIPFSELNVRAAFGIAFDSDEVVVDDKIKRKDNFASPLSYLVEEKLVGEDSVFVAIYPSNQIQHMKFGVDSNHPRGVTPWFRVFDSCIGKHEVLTSARSLMLRRAENSVIEKVTGGGDDEALDAIISKTKREQAKRKRSTGSSFVYGGRRITRSTEIEFLNLQLGMSDIINLIEKDELRIGKQIQAPDFITLQRSDMGARATSDNSVRPWNARIRMTQRRIARFNIEFLWASISYHLFGVIDAEKITNLKQFYEIRATGFMDPDQEIEGAHSRSIERFDRGIDTKEQVATAGGSVLLTGEEDETVGPDPSDDD